MLFKKRADVTMFKKARPESVLFITLDSCRYDTFINAKIPNLRAVGPIYRCMAPGNFTYSSHAAMFMGFTPGVAEASESFVNPLFGKIFKMRGGGFSGPGMAADHQRELEDRKLHLPPEGGRREISPGQGRLVAGQAHRGLYHYVAWRPVVPHRKRAPQDDGRGVGTVSLHTAAAMELVAQCRPPRRWVPPSRG